MSACSCSRLGFSFFLLLLTLPLTAVGALPALKRADAFSTTLGQSSLPAAAKFSISATLGRDQRAYHAMRANEGWQMENAEHGLHASFTTHGMDLRNRSARFGLRLTGFGRGARLAAVAAAMPDAKANRIAYRRGSVTEWYVNGPLGLEQGFTLRSPPAQKGSEALTLALHLSGDLSAVPDPRGDGMILQARAGGTAVHYRGLVAWDSTGHVLPTWWQGESREVRLRVDDAGARYPLTVDPIFEDAKLIASDGVAPDNFGCCVALSGDTIVIGAPFKKIGSSILQGSVYVFVKPPGGWTATLTETAKLMASDSTFGDLFGASVAVNSGMVVVGAIGSDIGGNANQGSAYIFVRPSGGWAGTLSENAKLIATDGATEDRFGFVEVAVSGDTVVVGAPGPGGNIGGNTNKGAAYVFVRPPGGWTGTLSENAKLLASDGTNGDNFGFPAASGDTVVVGAPQLAKRGIGSAYIFVKPPGGWTGVLNENAKLAPSDGAADDAFGSVDVDTDTVVVGASQIQSGGTGSAYVFVKPSGGWAGLLQENAKLTASDGLPADRFGASVALSGDRVVAGAPARGGSVGSNADPGSAYVFLKPPSGWAGLLLENAKLAASDGAGGDDFGSAVEISTDTLLVGAPFNNNQGAAYVFDSNAVGAQPATTRVVCRASGCRVSIICTLAPSQGNSCMNRIILLVGTIQFSSGIANIPPGQVRTIKLKLTKRGRAVVAKKKKRKLRGVIMISSTPGTAIATTPVTVLLK